MSVVFAWLFYALLMGERRVRRTLPASTVIASHLVVADLAHGAAGLLFGCRCAE